MRISKSKSVVGVQSLKRLQLVRPAFPFCYFRHASSALVFTIGLTSAVKSRMLLE
jgi:hypothetical protein